MTISLRSIRNTVLGQLQLGWVNVPCNSSTNATKDTITVSAIRDVVGDTDNRMLEGASFVPLNGSNSGVSSLSTTITTTDTSITPGSVKLFKAGDYITIDTEKMVVTNIDVAQGKLDVKRGALLTTIASHLSNAATGHIKIETAYQNRIISAHSFATDNITLTRSLENMNTTSGDVTQCDILLILNKQEIDECIRSALAEIWTKDRVEITPNTTDNRYNLTNSVSHLTDPSLLLSLKYRTYETGFANRSVYEIPVTNRLIEVDDSTVYATLYDLPAIAESGNTWKLLVETRKYMSPIYSEDETTSAPDELIIAFAKVKVLEKIFNKIGTPAAKANYGAELGEARRHRDKMYRKYKQAIQPMELVTDEPFVGPNLTMEDAEWVWDDWS